jgi:phosphoesterase RecJ-like protein
MDFRQQFIKAYNKIKIAKRVLVIAHVNPDGDALSSTGAFLELLNILSIESVAFCSGKKDTTFDYLPHQIKIISDKKNLPALISFDLLIILDCGSLSRTDLTHEILELKKIDARPYIIEFDHHPKMDDYSDLEIRNPDKAATAEIIYDFFRENKIAFNKNSANCILTGILTDTGNFLYPNSSEHNLEIASQMMSCGAQFPKIVNNILRNKNFLVMKLWGMAMNNLRINKKYNIAYSVITQDDLTELNKLGTPEEIEHFLHSDVFGDITGFLGNLSDVKAIMLLREEGGKIKGSLRTARPEVDISGLAKHLGGGGHPKASGFSVDGRIVKKVDSWEII